MSQCSRGAVRNIPSNVSHHNFRKSSGPPRVSTSRFCSANTPSISWPKFARKSAGNVRSRPRNILCESDKFDVGAIWAIPSPFLLRRVMPIASSEIVSSRAPAKAPYPFVPPRPQPLPCRIPSTGSNGGVRHPNQLPAARPIPQSARNFPGAPGCRTKSPRSAAPYPRCAAPLLSESRSRAFRHPPARSTPETSPASSAKTLPHSCSWSSPARLPARHAISPVIVLYRLQEDYIVTRYSFWHVRDHQAARVSAEISGGAAPQLCTVMPVLCALGTRPFRHRTARLAPGICLGTPQLGAKPNREVLDAEFCRISLSPYEERAIPRCADCSWNPVVTEERKAKVRTAPGQGLSIQCSVYAVKNSGNAEEMRSTTTPVSHPC